jgi:hypothetical protein
MKRQLRIDYDGLHYTVSKLVYWRSCSLLPWKWYDEYYDYIRGYDTYDDAKTAVEEMLKFPQYFEGESK